MMNDLNKTSIPLVNIIRSYKISWFRSDLIAGLTVASIAIPQSMAYAKLAGIPLINGLYTAIFAMIVYAFFTTTKHVIAGPDAATAALTGATIIPLAGSASQNAGVASMLAIIIGIGCLLAVKAKLSFVADFLSRPILVGYMAGLAFSVITSQLFNLFGFLAPKGSTFITTITYIIFHLGSTHILTLVLSVVLLISGILMMKYLPKIPSSLVLLVASIAISIIFDFDVKGVATVGPLSFSLVLPSLPDVSFYQVQNLVVPAIAIMIVAYANTIATARSFAIKEQSHITDTQEFMGLGYANIASGIFTGMPIATSGARTAINQQSNPKTQVAQIIGAILIGLILWLLSPLLQFLPLSALAVIVILAVWSLIDFNDISDIRESWSSEAVLAIITIIGVTLLGVLQGLILAVFLAVLNLIRKTAFPGDTILGVTKYGSFHDMTRPPHTESIPGIILYRFDAPLYFANAGLFRSRVLELINNSERPVRWFLWNAENATSLDSTAAAMLINLIDELKSMKVTFAVARMRGPVRSTIWHSHDLSRTYQSTPHFNSMKKAVATFREEQRDNKLKKIGKKVISTKK